MSIPEGVYSHCFFKECTIRDQIDGKSPADEPSGVSEEINFLNIHQPGSRPEEGGRSPKGTEVFLQKKADIFRFGNCIFVYSFVSLLCGCTHP